MSMQKVKVRGQRSRLQRSKPNLSDGYHVIDGYDVIDAYERMHKP